MQRENRAAIRRGAQALLVDAPLPRRARALFASPLRARGARALLAGALLGLAACASETGPAAFFQLEPESAANKAAQTRYFETADEVELLSASAAVLQDLGFQISESAHDVGFLRAIKERSARSRGQNIARFLVLLLSFGHYVMPVDLHQKIEAALVARPLDERATRHEVRIQFYRAVWKGDGQVNSQYSSQYIPPGIQRMEMVRDPLIYQEFFAKLSKAVFIEAQQI